jgi:hypothetical protein
VRSFRIASLSESAITDFRRSAVVVTRRIPIPLSSQARCDADGHVEVNGGTRRVSRALAAHQPEINLQVGGFDCGNCYAPVM